MPSSTKYSGNQFISRRERQSSVVIYNRKSAEVDKEAVYVKKTLTGVKIEITNRNYFSSEGPEKKDGCRLSVELRDGNPGYVNFNSWDETNTKQWTIQPGKDYFVANGQKFMINSLLEKHNVKGGIDVLEIEGNE